MQCGLVGYMICMYRCLPIGPALSGAGSIDGLCIAWWFRLAFPSRESAASGGAVALAFVYTLYILCASALAASAAQRSWAKLLSLLMVARGLQRHGGPIAT